jgi:hypothetical protein
MKPSREISHALAALMMKNAERALEPKRIAMAMGSKDGDMLMSAIRQKYTECVIKEIGKHRNAIISDYVIDLVEAVQPVLDKEIKPKDLQAIAKFISSPAFKSLLENASFIEACQSVRDKLNSKVIDIMNSEEVSSYMKSAARDVLDDITKSFGFDDETQS